MSMPEDILPDGPEQQDAALEDAQLKYVTGGHLVPPTDGAPGLASPD